VTKLLSSRDSIHPYVLKYIRWDITLCYSHIQLSDCNSTMISLLFTCVTCPIFSLTSSEILWRFPFAFLWFSPTFQVSENPGHSIPGYSEKPNSLFCFQHDAVHHCYVVSIDTVLVTSTPQFIRIILLSSRLWGQYPSSYHVILLACEVVLQIHISGNSERHCRFVEAF